MRQTGKPAEAEAERRQAMALYQKLADDDPAVYGSQVWFRDIDPIIERAERLSREGKLAEAEAAYRDALSSYQKLADDHPGVTEFRSPPGIKPLPVRRSAVVVGQADGGRG